MKKKKEEKKVIAYRVAESKDGERETQYVVRLMGVFSTKRSQAMVFDSYDIAVNLMKLHGLANRSVRYEVV